ncbi:MAG: flavoprotein [Thermoguttaceae bacterium]|nr:flavoprotein [Thermoguttaceae bacterium]
MSHLDKLQGRGVLVGVTGGIAAYKAADLVSRLTQRDAKVSVVMTAAAMEFVHPKTFEALSGRPVGYDMFSDGTPFAHLSFAKDGEVFCIVPATANILAKAAHGIADDLVSTLCLSFDGPVLFAPGMNCSMWKKPAVQRNVMLLQADGRQLIGPEEGHLACGEVGAGRMASVDTILDAIINALP